MSLTEQLIREHASAVIESRQEPDRYFYLIRDRKLVSPFTGNPVEWSMEKTTLLGQKEWASFREVQDWATNTDTEEGLAFWVSPSDPLRSPQTKVIVYEITDFKGEKALLNRTLLFNIDYRASLAIGNGIARAFENPSYFTHPEEVRARTIIAAKSMAQDEWLPIITEIINDQRQWEMIASGEDVLIEKKALAWVAQKGPPEYLGNNPLSCPWLLKTTASEVVMQNSMILEGKYVERCGDCKIWIGKIIFKGYKCKNCNGVYGGC